ncbi:hypothetical protein [Micromonospora sp. WMMD1082]|uniref:hypothetical protein n=1 Tax=Micromonospora sp. WMMD1082 TaxID=3016104 RepID=UPI002417B7A0|nr:hypothetical protein [Micromonospora sp. WMMD1082]MDG4795513.1 hypothetical protein [Micromonospora sp. WMMD1082]
MPHPLIDRAVTAWAAQRPTRFPDPLVSAVRAAATVIAAPLDPAWAPATAAALNNLDAARRHYGPHDRRTLHEALAVGRRLAPASDALAAVFYRAVAADGSTPHLRPHWDTLDWYSILHLFGMTHRIDDLARQQVPDLIQAFGYHHPLTVAACLTWAHHTTEATRLAAYITRQLHHIPTPTTHAALTALARLAGHTTPTQAPLRRGNPRHHTTDSHRQRVTEIP